MSVAQNELSLIGRRASALEVGEAVELKEDDLARLQEERGVQKAIPLKRIAARHHQLARMLASGTPSGEAGILCGYTASRVSILMSDPSFCDLQAHYANEIDAKFLSMTEKMANLGEDMVSEIADRLEDDPTQFSIDELYKGAALAADRSGHGPSQKTDVNVKIGLADRMKEAAQRVVDMRDGVIEAKIVGEGA